MNGQRREDIHVGLEVEIVLKKDQRTQPSRKATAGMAGKLTPQSRFAPAGQARRDTGRVQNIIGE